MRIKLTIQVSGAEIKTPAFEALVKVPDLNVQVESESTPQEVKESWLNVPTILNVMEEVGQQFKKCEALKKEMFGKN